MFSSPVSYCNLSACFCVLQVETQCMLRRTESSQMQRSLTSSRHRPSLVSGQPHPLSASWRPTGWFSVWFCFLCYLRDFSPTAYLLHQISQADQEATCDLTLSSPVTTSMPLKAHLGAKVMSSSGFSLLAACQLMLTQSLDRNDPSLEDTA